MKKVINITLGGIVFAMEQDAFDAMDSYLEKIKSKLVSNEDAKEVINDIESAIAEKFIARKRSEKLAVTVADVYSVISEMGNPAEFGEDVESDAISSKHSASDTEKRLYRDTDNQIIAGVASGLANYFDIDPVIVRLMFVIAIFFNGLGVFVYIVLWLVVPEAKTTAQKYAMRGKKVTLNQITDSVKRKIEEVDTEAIADTAKNTWGSLRSVFAKFFEIVGVVVGALIRIFRYFVGVVLVIAGALGVAALVLAYSIILLSDKIFFPADVQVVIEILQSSAIGIVAMFSSFIMMIIPLIVLVMAGACLLAKQNYFTVQKSVTLAVVWIVAVVVAGTTSALQVEKVMQKIGPIDGRFYDSHFEVEWKGGRIYSDKDEVFIYSTQENLPERLTIIGTYDCLYGGEVADPSSESCVPGIRTVEGLTYSLDFMLMSQTLPSLQVGEIITVSGVFTPAERLSASTWSDLDFEGILSATDINKKTE